MRASGSANSAMVVNPWTSVKTIGFPGVPAKLGGDRVVDDTPDDLLGNEAGERRDRALREVHGETEFANLLDV